MCERCFSQNVERVVESNGIEYRVCGSCAIVILARKNERTNDTNG